MVQVSIVLPVYNEELSVVKELSTIKEAMENSGFSYEIIVVDDGSTDKTSQMAEKFEDVMLIRHPFNRGSGAARKTGTLKAKGEVVVWSDIDQSYPNDKIPELVKMLYETGHDQVVGARMKESGTRKTLRKPAKYLIQKLACFLSGSEIWDLNSGLRAFRREIGMKYLYLLPEGFSCVATMTLAFLCNGHTVGYMPIDYFPRIGKSKFHPIKDTYQYLLQVVRMTMYFAPLRIFMPLGLCLFFFSIAKSIIDLIFTHDLQESDIIIFLFSFLIIILGLLADLIVVQHKERNLS